MNIQKNPFLPYVWKRSCFALSTLLEPKIRYMGNNINILSLEAMKNFYEIAATNLKLAGEKGDPQEQPLSTKLQPGIQF